MSTLGCSEPKKTLFRGHPRPSTAHKQAWPTCTEDCVFSGIDVMCVQDPYSACRAPPAVARLAKEQNQVITHLPK